MMIDRDIVRFCSIECKLQQSGELSVGWMIDAWLYAQVNSWDSVESFHGSYRLPTLDDVVNIGRLVEPNVNYGPGFRKVDVRVGYDIKMQWEQVPAAMVDLMERVGPSLKLMPDSIYPGDYLLLTAEKFFKEYEDIHPWQDGNGRSGVILFNWLSSTLDDPKWAPNFWNDSRRTIGYGA